MNSNLMERYGLTTDQLATYKDSWKLVKKKYPEFEDFLRSRSGSNAPNKMKDVERTYPIDGKRSQTQSQEHSAYELYDEMTDSQGNKIVTYTICNDTECVKVKKVNGSIASEMKYPRSHPIGVGHQREKQHHELSLREPESLKKDEDRTLYYTFDKIPKETAEALKKWLASKNSETHDFVILNDELLHLAQGMISEFENSKNTQATYKSVTSKIQRKFTELRSMLRPVFEHNAIEGSIGMTVIDSVERIFEMLAMKLSGYDPTDESKRELSRHLSQLRTFKENHQDVADIIREAETQISTALIPLLITNKTFDVTMEGEILLNMLNVSYSLAMLHIELAKKHGGISKISSIEPSHHEPDVRSRLSPEQKKLVQVAKVAEAFKDAYMVADMLRSKFGSNMYSVLRDNRKLLINEVNNKISDVLKRHTSVMVLDHIEKNSATWSDLDLNRTDISSIANDINSLMRFGENLLNNNRTYIMIYSSVFLKVESGERRFVEPDVEPVQGIFTTVSSNVLDNVTMSIIERALTQGKSQPTLLFDNLTPVCVDLSGSVLKNIKTAKYIAEPMVAYLCHSLRIAANETREEVVLGKGKKSPNITLFKTIAREAIAKTIDAIGDNDYSEYKAFSSVFERVNEYIGASIFRKGIDSAKSATFVAGLNSIATKIAEKSSDSSYAERQARSYVNDVLGKIGLSNLAPRSEKIEKSAFDKMVTFVVFLGCLIARLCNSAADKHPKLKLGSIAEEILQIK